MRMAVLDGDGNHTGYRTGDSPGQNEVVVPDNCDLVAGQYRWTGSTFLPRIDLTNIEDQIPPNPLRMIAKALRTIQASGVNFDSDVLSWLDGYERTTDGAGIGIVRER